MKRNVIYLIFSFYIFSAFSQIGNEAYNFAMQQFKKQNYTEAAKEFNRALFLETQHTANCYKHIAECYIVLNDFELSNYFYDKAYFALENDSLKTDVLLRKAYSNILQKQFKSAYYELINIDSLYGSVQTNKFWLYTGAALYGNDDYKHAQISFENIFDSTEIAQLSTAFNYLEKMQKRHKPSKVETMSFLLPGLGQIHTGNTVAGLHSAALLGGIFFGMVQVGRLYSPFDGLFLFAPWFQRYYMGGAEKAKHMAEHKLVETKNDVFNRILEIGEANE